MRFTEKCKRFWSLRAQNNSGFTLVELIVVIAILAILAGVAVPAYSGYVEKANKQADMTLASEVEQALMLGHYSEGITDGYVILTEDGMFAGDSVKNTLLASFGENWNERVLVYDGWKPELLSEITSSEAILNSSYIQGVGTQQLLSDVQKCSSALGEFLGLISNSDWNGVANTLADKLNVEDNEVFSNIMSDAGYYDEETGTFINVTKAALGNATVMCVADYVNNNSDEIYKHFTDIDNLYLNDTPYSFNGSETMIYDVACWYASMEALVSHLGGEPERMWREDLDMTGGDAATILTGMTAVQTEIMNYYVSTPELTEEFLAYYTPDDITGKSQAMLDAETYISMMKTVNNVGEDVATPEFFDDDNLLTGAMVSEKLEAYVGGAKMKEELSTSDDPMLKKILNGTYEGSCGVVYLICMDEEVKCYSDMSEAK